MAEVRAPEVAGESPNLEAWFALLHAHAALTECVESELITKHGLTLSSFSVLLDLSRSSDGRLRLQELQSCALMTKSGVTRLIDRMESEGLVCRMGCPEDKRGSWAVLTDLGRERIAAASPTHMAAIEQHFGQRLSPEKARELQASLHTLVEVCTGDASPKTAQ